jgi:hypothetical protein
MAASKEEEPQKYQGRKLGGHRARNSALQIALPIV